MSATSAPIQMVAAEPIPSCESHVAMELLPRELFR